MGKCAVTSHVSSHLMLTGPLDTNIWKMQRFFGAIGGVWLLSYPYVVKKKKAHDSGKSSLAEAKVFVLLNKGSATMFSNDFVIKELT